jgi:hypothetical protein
MRTVLTLSTFGGARAAETLQKEASSQWGVFLVVFFCGLFCGVLGLLVVQSCRASRALAVGSPPTSEMADVESPNEDAAVELRRGRDAEIHSANKAPKKKPRQRGALHDLDPQSSRQLYRGGKTSNDPAELQFQLDLESGAAAAPVGLRRSSRATSQRASTASTTSAASTSVHF